MFFIASRLNIPEVEDSRIRILFPPRRKGAKFEGEIQIFLTNDFHVFSPTFAAFASLREIFRVSVAAVRRQVNLFSQRSLGKSVYYYTRKFARLAKIFR